jgi:hypothetical protein
VPLGAVALAVGALVALGVAVGACDGVPTVGWVADADGDGR